MKEICGALNSECRRCNPGGCSFRIVEGEKPTTFNIGKYREAVRELEEIKKVNAALENEIIAQRICIRTLKAEIDELRSSKPTISRLIEEIKVGVCKLCANEEACREAIENGDDYPCALDLL